jgi:chitinase
LLISSCTFIKIDASASYANTDVSPSYQVAVAKLVHGLSSAGNKPITTTTTVKTTTTKSSATKTNSASASSLPTSTKTVTVPSTTTSTAAPTTDPTNVPIVCVKDGQTCSNEGQLSCSGDSFGVCNHGKWSLRGCPSGLTCFSTADGASVYCAQGTGKNTCPSDKKLLTTTITKIAKPKNKKPVKGHQGPAAKPYKSGRITAQFSVTHSNAKSFVAIINARRLDKRAFGKTLIVQFKVDKNIRITKVKNGKVTQRGNNVKIQYKNSDKKTMMAVIEVHGAIKSGVFVAPNANTLKFSS